MTQLGRNVVDLNVLQGKQNGLTQNKLQVVGAGVVAWQHTSALCIHD